MTTHVPRGPYTPEELAQLYPKDLELQLVQIVRQTLYILVALVLCSEYDSNAH
jgi:hypothetical protein